jgi:CBS domain-containing protein
MKARDVMTEAVASVQPDTPVAAIAALLLARKISAVPVVDATGAPIGMVSEGDLIDGAAARGPFGDWWLKLLTADQAAATEVRFDPTARERVAREVMSSPVVTIVEEAELAEIAQLLARYRIKRVPVVRQGRIVGIVSRADLLRGFAETPPSSAAKPRSGWVAQLLAEIDGGFRHRNDRPSGPDRQSAEETEIAAGRFRDMMKAFERSRALRDEERRAAEAKRREQLTTELGEQHLADSAWQELLHRAEEAAKRGESEFLMLRFPSQLCSDGGRAVNAPEPTWPETLRGEAAELYLRFDREIKPHGFELAARVLDYPGGIPGDIGLFLTWPAVGGQGQN